MLLQVMLQACNEQIICNERAHSEKLSEVLETMAMFCANINMMGVNRNLFDSIHSEANNQDSGGALLPTPSLSSQLSQTNAGSISSV